MLSGYLLILRDTYIVGHNVSSLRGIPALLRYPFSGVIEFLLATSLTVNISKNVLLRESFMGY